MNHGGWRYAADDRGEWKRRNGDPRRRVVQHRNGEAVLRAKLVGRRWANEYLRIEPSAPYFER